MQCNIALKTLSPRVLESLGPQVPGPRVPGLVFVVSLQKHTLCSTSFVLLWFVQLAWEHPRLQLLICPELISFVWRNMVGGQYDEILLAFTCSSFRLQYYQKLGFLFTFLTTVVQFKIWSLTSCTHNYMRSRIWFELSDRRNTLPHVTKKSLRTPDPLSRVWEGTSWHETTLNPQPWLTPLLSLILTVWLLSLSHETIAVTSVLLWTNLMSCEMALTFKFCFK